MNDSVVITLSTGQVIRKVVPVIYVTPTTGYTILARDSATKKKGVINPVLLPLSTAAINALATKADANHTHAGVYQPADADLTTYAGITPSANVQTMLASANNAAIRSNIGAGTGDGTLTAIGITTANGISGSSSGGTTPNLTITLGAITPSSVAATGAITSSGAGIGYATGAGGTVTQSTSKSTGVTLNKVCGDITLNGAALAAGAVVSFTLTNSTIAATDNLVLNHITTGTRGAYNLNANCAAGSATIYIRNTTSGSLSEAIVIRYSLIKTVNN